jgi:hypothetical protein
LRGEEEPNLEVMVDDKAEDLHCSDIEELLILHYELGHTPFAKNHADSSGIFKANKWVTECRQSRQRLTFAGVNAHHQNGVAKRKIRELQDMTRLCLIHG